MGKTFNDDDQQILSDRLENAGAVVCFLGEASRALADQEDPMTATGLYGMLLVFQWLQNDIEAVQRFILEGKSLC